MPRSGGRPILRRSRSGFAVKQRLVPSGCSPSEPFELSLPISRLRRATASSPPRVAGSMVQIALTQRCPPVALWRAGPFTSGSTPRCQEPRRGPPAVPDQPLPISRGSSPPRVSSTKPVQKGPVAACIHSTAELARAGWLSLPGGSASAKSVARSRFAPKGACKKSMSSCGSGIGQKTLPPVLSVDAPCHTSGPCC